MKSLCVTLLSLALCASCSTVGTDTTSTGGPTANVSTASGDGACCGDAATGSDCCSAPTKAKAVAEIKVDAAAPGCCSESTQAKAVAETKVDAAAPGCCGACAPEAAPKQP